MNRKAFLTVLALMLAIFGMGTNASAIDGLAPVGQAFVNPAGLGDSLIFGYYNTRGNASLISIVNTDATDGEKVRIVFRAGRTSEEVLDFSICLSKGDVWTGIIFDNGTTAAICRFDTDTLTAPEIPAACQTFKIPVGSTLTNDDLREGYIEVLGLSSIPNYDKNALTSAACTRASGPQNCIRTPLDCADWGRVIVPGTDVANVIFGTQTIFDLTNLGTYHYDATAIANTNLIPVSDPGPGQEMTLTQVSNLGCALERIFAKSEIIVPYDIIAVLGGETEIIITFPTRRPCHRCDDPGSAVNNLGLNSCPTPGPGTGNIFNCKQAVAGVCTAYETLLVISAWDIAENEQRVLQFSPAGDTVLPFEVNVVRIGNSSIWNSTLAQSFGLISGFDLGWVGLNIAQGAAIQGLPAIAYLSQAFVGEEASFMAPAIYKSLIP